MTELTWEGKYKDGKKTAPVRIALPFQTIETINESAADRAQRLSSLFSQRAAAGDWRNRLIWDDKKYVLPSLLPEFAGKVNLIYIDPPFDTGANFSFTATIPDHPDTDEDESTSFVKEPSMIEQKAYRDTWGRGLDSYLQWFYETALLLRELLAEDGSIYVHLDWHVGHYAKAVLDEIFGAENFRNEIIWKRASTVKGNFGQGSKLWSPNVDNVFYYTKGRSYTFTPQFQQYTQEYIDSFFRYKEKDGRRFRLISMIGPGGEAKGNPVYEIMGITRAWRYSKEKMYKLISDGLVVQTNLGTVPQRKQYLDDGLGVSVQTLWNDVEAIGASSNEKVGYATQKPESLKRIIKASSDEGDLVLDCFCGSGTTAAVAEKLGRRWITCDLGRFAIHTARKRLLGIPEVKPFTVQNLGKYERQQWMHAEFEDATNRVFQEKSYRHFIAEIYHDKPLDGYTWLHAAKAGRMVHIGGVEAPVTVEDIKAAVLEFWRLVGNASAPLSDRKSAATAGIDFLGWDFAFDVNETAKQFAAENKVAVSFKKIPREVLEKKAVEQGDIRFYELASLELKTTTKKLQASISLENFIIPPDDVPQDVQGKITHWSQWIDYWAIDWNYREDTFHNEWQSYRTRQQPKIELTAQHGYEQAGSYTVLVKVIDILGNDTTKAITIKVS